VNTDYRKILDVIERIKEIVDLEQKVVNELFEVKS